MSALRCSGERHNIIILVFCPQTVAFYNSANEVWQKWQSMEWKVQTSLGPVEKYGQKSNRLLTCIQFQWYWLRHCEEAVVFQSSRSQSLFQFFLYMMARNQLLHNVAILWESAFNFKFFMARDEVEEVPGEILMDWRISSFRILQLGLKSNWQYDFLLFHLYANCI